MSYEMIRFAIEGSVGWITLNQPRKANALSRRMIAEIDDALRRAAADEALKALILNAEGRHFCAGHDMREMLGGGARECREIFENCARMMQRIHEIPQPVIAQVQGTATAAGCQLAAWCDLAVAEQDARFATPGVHIGLFCTTPMVALTRAVGRKAALEMLLTGRFIDAPEAQRLGLVNRVVPLTELADAARNLAEEIAAASRFVLALGKQAFYHQIDADDTAALDYATRTMSFNLMADDAQIGIRAFLDKDVPVWRNR